MIDIVVGDITRLDTDAIVNAANPNLLGGGGVDGAIHGAAGPSLLEACRKLGGCPPGDARITGGFDLPARFVIHAVGPIWRGGTRGEATLLERCYRACFELAAENAVCSIAYPAISTGAYGFPKRDAARIAIRVMREHEARFERIVACCFAAEDARIYRTVLDAM